MTSTITVNQVLEWCVDNSGVILSLLAFGIYIVRTRDKVNTLTTKQVEDKKEIYKELDRLEDKVDLVDESRMVAERSLIELSGKMDLVVSRVDLNIEYQGKIQQSLETQVAHLRDKNS